MKTINRMTDFVLCSIVLLGSVSCSSDWGKQDPPAGVSTFPKLERVASYDFEDPETAEGLVFKGATPDARPDYVADDVKGGKVLALNGGWVEMKNPLNAVTCEKAASLTFYMKQIPSYAEAEEGKDPVKDPQDVSAPLFTFENENGSGHLYFNANGGIDFKTAEGTWYENDPATVKTGYIPEDQWNYVALTVSDEGYELYVNGERKVAKTVSDFDCKRLVAFMNKAPKFTVSSPNTASLWLVDDISVYRNALTDKETARPRLPGENQGGGDDGPDLSKWILVGLEDNTTPFWSNWAPYVTLKGDGVINYEFYNYNNGSTNNWCNWLICLATAERGADGYSEYLVERSDAYGWGTAYNGDNISHDFNWDTFMTDMNGALVNLTIERSGQDVDITAKVTASTGATYNYRNSITGVNSPELVTFLFAEGAHLLLNPEGCFIGTNYSPALAVGPEDFSAAWWTVWSPLQKVSGDYSNFGYILTNHEKDGASNWNNWVLVCTNGKYIGDDGYAENFVLRSDAYGWGACYNGDNISHGYDWDTFTADMRDAHVVILTERSGDDFDMIARQTRADGTAIPDYRFSATIPAATSPDLGLFFVLDGNWLEIQRAGYFPFLSMNPSN